MENETENVLQNAFLTLYDTGVAFVKGAHERNEFFRKINKQ